MGMLKFLLYNIECARFEKQIARGFKRGQAINFHPAIF